MKKLFSLLFFLLAFTINAQTTVVNKLKIKNGTEDNAASRVLVQDETTKEINYVSKANFTNGFIPLSGTLVGHPITGNLQLDLISDEDSFKIYNSIPDYYEEYLKFNWSSIQLNAKDLSTNYATDFAVGINGIDITSNNPTSRGISSTSDFTSNITDLDFVQKKYVDQAIALSGNLQAVTDAGNTTTNNIKANSFQVYDSPDDKWFAFASEENGFKIIDASNDKRVLTAQNDNLTLGDLSNNNQISFKNDLLSNNHVYNLPNNDGTIALLSDISSGSGIPLTGTTTGNPVTGEIEMGNDVGFYEGSTSSDFARLSLVDNSFNFYGYSLGFNSSVGAVFNVQDGMYINCNYPTARGLRSDIDYTANIDSLSYTQKKYVDTKIALSGTETGKPITGNFEIDSTLGHISKIFQNQDEAAQAGLEFNNVDPVLRLYSENNDLTIQSQISLSSGTLSISTTNYVIPISIPSNGVGLMGSFDYSDNLDDDKQYIQKSYSDKQRGKFISKTTTEINAISSPQNGETYFNTNLNVLCFYDGTDWQRVVYQSMN